MTICDDCIHDDVCGKEGHLDEAMIFCADKVSDVTRQSVRRGRWIITDDVEHFIAVCSECGRTEDSRCIKDMPYCHCGARMDLKDGDAE